MLNSTLLLAALAASPGEFRAMSYNIWIGGTQSQPLTQTAKVIQTSGANIVGIQEPAESLPKLAEMLRWNHSSKASILTHYRIVEDWKVEGNRWGGAKIELPNGQMVLVYNDHLNPYPYGPYEVRDKKATTTEALNEVDRASGRVAQMERILAHWRARPDRDLPTIITGDFNTPSHLDWVASTASRNFGLTMPWMVTRMAEDAGFTDAFRAVHPDPENKPGFTWSPGYPVGKLEPNDVMDRIDFVISRGNLTPKHAWVVGESGPVTDIAIDPWPSDHRAVLIEFGLNNQ